MSDINTMDAGQESAALRAKNLIVAIFNKGEGKTYEFAYKLLWFVIPLDLVLLYILNGFQRSPIFLLNIIAFKLLFIMLCGWVFRKFNISRQNRSAIQGIDWSVGMIWLWFWSDILMMVIFPFGDGEHDPLMVYLPKCGVDFVAALKLFHGGITFFVYAFLGVLLSKLIAKLLSKNTEKPYEFRSGKLYWLTCCIVVAVMNGVALNFYITS